MDYYMMTGDGRRVGPMPKEALVNHGLAYGTMVWRQDFPQWVPASQVPELQTLLNSMPQMPPSPPGTNGFQQACPPPATPSYNQQQNGGQTAPDNYLVWAILSTVLCCLPFGIVSIVYSSKVNSLWAQGLYVESKDASDKAKMWAMIALGCGLVSGVLGFILGIAGAL